MTIERQFKERYIWWSLAAIFFFPWGLGVVYSITFTEGTLMSQLVKGALIGNVIIGILMVTVGLVFYFVGLIEPLKNKLMIIFGIIVTSFGTLIFPTNIAPDSFANIFSSMTSGFYMVFKVCIALVLFALIAGTLRIKSNKGM